MTVRDIENMVIENDFKDRQEIIDSVLDDINK